MGMSACDIYVAGRKKIACSVGMLRLFRLSTKLLHFDNFDKLAAYNENFPI